MVPELASRDHIRRVLPLTREVLDDCRLPLERASTPSPTPQGPGLAGALLVGASIASALAFALGIPALGIHHLEGHLLSPLLVDPAAGLSLRRAAGVGRAHAADAGRRRRRLRTAGRNRWTMPPAKPSTRPRSCSAWAIPAARRSRSWREHGHAGRFNLPRPDARISGNLNFSFSGLEDRRAALVSKAWQQPLDDSEQAPISPRRSSSDRRRAGEQKSLRALKQTGLKQLVVAGGVGANPPARAPGRDAAHERGCDVFYPRSNSAPTTAR